MDTFKTEKEITNGEPMRKIISTLLASLLMTSPGFATMLDLNLLGGAKVLSETDWGSNDVHGAVGAEAVVSPPLFPLSFVGGYLYTASSEDNSATAEELDAETKELYLGIGKKIDLPLIHFLISAGPAWIRARQDQASTLSTAFSTDDDNGVGYFVAGSTFFQVLGHLNLGLMVRYSAADVDLNGREIKAGGMSYLGVLGVGF
jgi:hypothetical protein